MVLVRDCVSNFVACINQSSKAKKKIVVVRHSNLVANIASLLYKKGYILGYRIVEDSYLIIQLKYYKNESVIHRIERISKPGRKVFMSNNQITELSRYMFGDSDYVVSTSSGLRTAKDCLVRGLAGEILFKIN